MSYHARRASELALTALMYGLVGWFFGPQLVNLFRAFLFT